LTTERYAYTPLGAPHITSLIDRAEIDEEDCVREPQKVDATCTICDAFTHCDCKSGKPELHVYKFALVHMVCLARKAT
jgi:hypothetical protein